MEGRICPSLMEVLVQLIRIICVDVSHADRCVSNTSADSSFSGRIGRLRRRILPSLIKKTRGKQTIEVYENIMLVNVKGGNFCFTKKCCSFLCEKIILSFAWTIKM